MFHSDGGALRVVLVAVSAVEDAVSVEFSVKVLAFDVLFNLGVFDTVLDVLAASTWPGGVFVVVCLDDAFKEVFFLI